MPTILLKRIKGDVKGKTGNVGKFGGSRSNRVNLQERDTERNNRDM